MVWSSFVQESQNFARCFHTAINLLTIGLCAMVDRIFEEKIEENEAEIRKNLLIFWFFSTLIFCGTFGITSYYNIRNGRHNWKPRHQKLKDLKVGMIGLFSCAVIEVCSSIYMIYNDCAGYIVLALAHVAALIFLGLYVLEQSYMCKFPKKFVNLEDAMFLAAMGIGFFILIERSQVACFQAAYITAITCFLIDIYTVFVDSSKIHFLGEFLGKRVVCKDMNGNEYIGDFVSVDADEEEKLYMRLKLENVEKHPGCVTLDEISSLKLVSDSTLTVSSSKVLEFLKKRVVCKDNEGNEYRGDVELVFAGLDVGEEFSFVKLRNVEKKCDGEFVKHTEQVSLREVASMELAGSKKTA